MNFFIDSDKRSEYRALISVVVIGRNEGQRLRRCLESVMAMDHKNFSIELIYVDSGSTDDSIEMASNLGAKTIALTPEFPSAALGRNAGWRVANGSIILFLDGDTILHPQFVANSISSFKNPKIAVVWGHRREIYPNNSIYNRILDLDWIYKPGLTLYCGGDALFRYDILEKIGGYDETLIAGEEPELCQRIASTGFVIQHVDLPMTGHDLAITHWRQYWKRSTRAGHAFAEVSRRLSLEKHALWKYEARRNRNRFFLFISLFLISIAGGIIFASWIPVGLLALSFASIVIRSAWKARWKTNDLFTLLLYGAHSHLQQFPIFLGQMQYNWNRYNGKRSMLLEYKQPLL